MTILARNRNWGTPMRDFVRQGRAVVVGASIAGLFAGRALADHFDDVILLDKEGLDQGPLPRKAVPQGNHIHAILPPTYRVIRRFMPQLIDDLVAGGANIIDGGTEWKFHVYGDFMVRGDTEQTLIGSTRPYFEDRLRSCCRYFSGRESAASSTAPTCLSNSITGPGGSPFWLARWLRESSLSGPYFLSEATIDWWRLPPALNGVGPPQPIDWKNLSQNTSVF